MPLRLLHRLECRSILAYRENCEQSRHQRWARIPPHHYCYRSHEARYTSPRIQTQCARELKGYVPEDVRTCRLSADPTVFPFKRLLPTTEFTSHHTAPIPHTFNSIDTLTSLLHYILGAGSHISSLVSFSIFSCNSSIVDLSRRPCVYDSLSLVFSHLAVWHRIRVSLPRHSRYIWWHYFDLMAKRTLQLVPMLVV